MGTEPKQMMSTRRRGTSRYRRARREPPSVEKFRERIAKVKSSNRARLSKYLKH